MLCEISENEIEDAAVQIKSFIESANEKQNMKDNLQITIESVSHFLHFVFTEIVPFHFLEKIW